MQEIVENNFKSVLWQMLTFYNETGAINQKPWY